MSLKDDYLLTQYEEVMPLSEESSSKIFIVKKSGTNTLFTKKEISYEVYQILSKKIGRYHPNVVSTYELLSSSNGQFFAIEEYITGQTLEEMLEKNGHLSSETSEKYINQLLEGVTFIHSLGIIHRDIKPENIIITGDGILKLTDFGISREKTPKKNRDTTILGTEGYAAPEQFGFSQSDERTDIYACGVLLNVMLTGYIPRDYITENKKYNPIIAKATSMDPAERYKSASEMKKALHYTTSNILPGFRSGKKWKAVLAGIIYTLCILLFSMYLFDALLISRKNILREIFSAFLVFIVFPLIAGNIFYFDRFFSRILHLHSFFAVIIRFIIAFMIFYVGMDLYVGVYSKFR